MIEIVSEKNLAQYEQFIASHPKGHFMQSIMWARQKPEWRWQAIMVRRDDGEIAGIGKHDELLRTCAVYREIYESQYKKEA